MKHESRSTNKFSLTPKDIVQNTAMYDIYFNMYRMEDGWLPDNKQQNFSLMLELVDKTGIPLSGTACLDVGCGTGDLSLTLRKRGIKEYLGIDVYAPSIEEAKKKYPSETFVCADFLSYKLGQMFDYAFCSGALTVRLPDTDNYTYLEAAVSKMWEATTIGVVFNVLTDEDHHGHPDLFFFSQEKVAKMCRKIIGDSEMYIEHTGNVDQIHVYLYRVGVPQLV